MENDLEEEKFYSASFREVSDPEVSDPFVKARIGTLIFIISEIMLFGGLISSFFVIRESYPEWPPEDLPVYPVYQTTLNTFILLTSGFLVSLFDKNKRPVFYFIAIVLGVIFLLLQGLEWVRLINHGLTMTTDRYGSIFYVIVGTHALHCVAGIVWLIVAYLLRRGRDFTPALLSSSLFWKFVVIIWPFIYLLVYIL